MPATYDFNLTRDQIIAGALRTLGVIAQGQTPDSDQVTDAAESLNMMLKSWSVEGIPIWAIKRETFTPSAGVSYVAIGDGQTVDIPKPLKLYQAYYTNTDSDVNIPMIGLTQQQYFAMSNPAQTGTTTQYYWDDKNTFGNLYLYLTPDANFVTDNTITIVYQAPFADFDASTDTPDVPQELLKALKFNLAAELAFEYGYPAKDRRDLIAVAEQYKDEAFAFIQEEGSLFFQIDRMRM